MKNMKTIKTKKFLQDSLWEKYQKGIRHTKQKNEHNSTKYIHSFNTYKTYKRQCEVFGNWCHQKGYKDPQEAFKHVPEYIDELKHDKKSAWTISTALNAIAKAYGVSTQEINVEIPKRHRSQIKRSRNDVKADSSIDYEKNAFLITFCKCYGLRKHKELEKLLVNEIDPATMSLYVKSGKGGKSRTVEFCGSEEEKAEIREYLKTKKPTEKVFEKVLVRLDVHGLRQDYACRLYQKHARPLNTLRNDEIYHCRGDLKGQWYDKAAMKLISQNLGHNRLDVVLNYIFKINPEH